METKNLLIVLALVVLSVIIYNSQENFANKKHKKSSKKNKKGSKKKSKKGSKKGSKSSSIPKGAIIAWNGEFVPSGWLLCDGSNGTPDLRSRFIVGAGQGTGLSAYKLDALGGAETVVLTKDQLPAHAHSTHVSKACFKNGGCDTRWAIEANPSKPAYKEYGTLNSLEIGSNGAHENRPPYYALAWIMKD